MIHTREFIRLGYGTASALIVLLGLSFSDWVSAASYEGLLQAMRDRQDNLENHLMNPRRYLGERLDGLLEINSSCPAEARELAEAENSNRNDLYGLMATDLNLSSEQVGKARADRYLSRYRQGILRQVRTPEFETTWWDGFPPDPRKLRISRVLSQRYARIYERSDPSSSIVRDNVQQYEAFGVIDSTEDGSGERWYKVTEDYVPKVKPPGWAPKILGWISEKNSVPWHRAVVMRFTSPYQRDLSLFFREREPLLEIMRLDLDSRKKRLDGILSKIEKGDASQTGVLAMEPRVSSGQERITMYPVLDFYGRESGNKLRIDGKSTLLLEVAARTRTGGGNDEGGSQQTVPVDVVFVMDTTHSMKPYLEDILAATEEFTKISGSDGLRFGFVGYQDSDPAFEYEVKEFTENTQPADAFLQALRTVQARPTPAKGDDIPEAVFEGLDTAIDSSQWRDDAVKIIVLVGDAPGREEKLSMRSLRDKAFARKIGIFALHIKTSNKASSWSRKAEKQYRELSSTYQGAYGTSQQSSHFMSVDAGSSDFRNLVLGRFREAQEGLDTIRTAAQSGPDSLPEVETGSLSDLIFQQASVLLADESVPENDVRGWISDKVLTNADREALAPMVLLTMVELDELAQRVDELKRVGEAALRGDGGTTIDFFDLVSKNTRITMVDPTAVNFRDAFAVPLGIDQLPYDSDIMSMTRDEFQNTDRVQGFVRAMKNKLSHYEDLRRQQGNPDVWKRLSKGAQDQDRVAGIELNQLP